jgi:hypothetical protein
MQPNLSEGHEREFLLRYQYPAGWIVAQDIPGVRYVFRDATAEDSADPGGISLQLIHRDSAADLVQIARRFASQFDAVGIRRSGAPICAVPPPRGFSKAVFHQPVAMRGGKFLETPIYVLEHAKAIVLLTLLGTAREDNPRQWARNAEAFTRIRDSLTLGEPAATPDSRSTQTPSARAAPMGPAPSPSIIVPPPRKKFPDAGSY